MNTTHLYHHSPLLLKLSANTTISLVIYGLPSHARAKVTYFSNFLRLGQNTFLTRQARCASSLPSCCSCSALRSRLWLSMQDPQNLSQSQVIHVAARSRSDPQYQSQSQDMHAAVRSRLDLQNRERNLSVATRP
jgi:hypothetical protein